MSFCIFAVYIINKSGGLIYNKVEKMLLCYRLLPKFAGFHYSLALQWTQYLLDKLAR